MKLVYIEWEDATANSEWFTKDQAQFWAKNCGTIVKECGWIVEETKTHITLASRYHTDSSGLKETMFGGLQKIPKTWLLKKRVIK